jgi:nucleoside-diphosphate-sugar epimerase
MAERTAVVTGANGEIGHLLLETLSARNIKIIAADLNPLDPHHAAMCEEVITGDICDDEVIRDIEKHDVHEIYHLAALLSTSAEKNPEKAHKINVEGTLNFLQLAYRLGKRMDTAVKVLFPSTIAIYGISTLEQKNAASAAGERDFNTPATMYGANKLYNEHLGAYYSDHYRRLSPVKESGYVDFRALRFPGLISAFTTPTGGTSDFAPEMIHAAAQNKPYACFVRPDATIPFMAMPDAVKALLSLAEAAAGSLTQRVYNVTSFSPSAGQIAEMVKKAFPEAQISFSPDINRQAIIDSWPAEMDDSKARQDWGWAPDYDFEKAFMDYLIPNIRAHYAG